MKRIKAYIPNVLLTFLLVFALLGAELLAFVQAAVLNPAVFRRITKQEQLGEVTYEVLEQTFSARSHSTGIPADVVMHSLAPQLLEESIDLQTEALFADLRGTQSAGAQPDFSLMQHSLRKFLEDYADENGYEKDAAFEEKAAALTEECTRIVEGATDPFRFGTLRRNGWLDTGRKYLSYLRPAMIGCIVAAVLLMALLLLCNRSQKALLAYWYGLAAMICGLLLLLPCGYLKATDYFAAFALKEPQTYTAVVGLLRLLTDRALLLGVLTAVTGAVLLIVSGILNTRSSRKEAAAP
ncbi:MAG: hypothetical protein IKN55_06260 [Oscillospiraceae bacterium]|nr:hypothetical protein [Oscillospiraceae bacterium]